MCVFCEVENVDFEPVVTVLDDGPCFSDRFGGMLLVWLDLSLFARFYLLR